MRPLIEGPENSLRAFDPSSWSSVVWTLQSVIPLPGGWLGARQMWIGTIGVILAILCPSGLIYAAGLMPVPAMAAAERGEYQARNARTGGELWWTRWALDRTTAEGHTLIRVQEDGRGRRDSDVPTVWTVHMTLDLSSQALRLSLAR